MNINKAYAREMVSWNRLLGESAIRKQTLRGSNGQLKGARETERTNDGEKQAEENPGTLPGHSAGGRTTSKVVSPFLPETVIPTPPKAVGTRSLWDLTILRFSECQ